MLLATVIVWLRNRSPVIAAPVPRLEGAYLNLPVPRQRRSLASIRDSTGRCTTSGTARPRSGGRDRASCRRAPWPCRDDQPLAGSGREPQPRASSRFVRKNSDLVRAEVEVRRLDIDTFVETIAHELEHVVEQLDDVDLTRSVDRQGVRAGGSWNRLAAFETERALRLGRAVAAEFRTSTFAHHNLLRETAVMRALLSIAILAFAARAVQDGHSLVAIQGAVDHPGVPTVDLSADGRFVAFESAARLSEADKNSYSDIYVLDRTTGTIVARDRGGRPDDGHEHDPTTERGRTLPGVQILRSRTFGRGAGLSGVPEGPCATTNRPCLTDPNWSTGQRMEPCAPYQRRWSDRRI